MDAELKQKIESWLSTKLQECGIGVGCMQPTVTWSYRDTDLSELQPEIGNYFSFSVSGDIPEADIIKAYERDVPCSDAV